MPSVASVGEANGRAASIPSIGNPIMAQFLSPDPFIQSPGNWFNYNRYGYCLNNPLIYSDPSGEFLGTIFTYTVDFIKTSFFKGGLDITSIKSIKKAWKGFDPTASWSPTNKAWKIDIGGFKTDPNLKFGERSWQFTLFQKDNK